jgi:hypothetical protein
VEHHVVDLHADWRVVLVVHDFFVFFYLDVQASTKGGINV